VTIGVPVSYRVGNMIASAVTLNVGPKGLAVRTTSPLEVGTSARVRFRLPGGKTEVEGEAHVTWTRSGLGMGLRFGTPVARRPGDPRRVRPRRTSSPTARPDRAPERPKLCPHVGAPGCRARPASGSIGELAGSKQLPI